MAHLVTFRSSKFDPKAEPANPINPIAGHAVLTWLAPAVRAAGYACGEPEAEDWGWYLDVSGHDGTYLVGASGQAEPEESSTVDWTVQIHRHRSLTDKLFGRNVHAADDSLTALVERLVRAEPGFTNIELEHEG